MSNLTSMLKEVSYMRPTLIELKSPRPIPLESSLLSYRGGFTQLEELSVGMLYNPLFSVSKAPLSRFSMGEKDLYGNSLCQDLDVQKKRDPIANFIDCKILSGTNMSTTSRRLVGRSLDFVTMRDRLRTTLVARKKNTNQDDTRLKVPMFSACDNIIATVNCFEEDRSEASTIPQAPHLLA